MTNELTPDERRALMCLSGCGCCRTFDDESVEVLLGPCDNCKPDEDDYIDHEYDRGCRQSDPIALAVERILARRR